MTTEKEISIWVKALLLILEEGNKEKLSLAAVRLREILAKKKKSYLLPKIVKKLEAAWARKNKAELFLAREHSARSLSLLEKKLVAIFGQKKNIEVKIKDDLIGGFLAKTDAIMVRASVKDFLGEIKNNLLSN